MPILLCEAERVALRPGPNVLGGGAADAVPLAPLALLPACAAVVVRADAPAVLRRLAPGAAVRLDGRALGRAPVALRDGAHLEIEGCHLTYVHRATARPGAGDDAPGGAPNGDAAAGGTGGAGEPPNVEPGGGAGAGRTGPRPVLAAETRLVPALAAAGEAFAPGDAGGGPDGAPPWHLVDARTGRTFALPAAGAVIGREAGCHVMVAGAGVSRRHATLERAGDGYVLTDRSANGTLLNGAPLAGPAPVRDGDVVQVGDEELRVHAGPPAPRPGTPNVGATAVLPALAREPHDGPAADDADAAAGRGPSAAPLAALRVAGGLLGGRTHHVARAVCTVGRGADADLRLEHPSVSAAHATLLYKRGRWYVVDLESANGTYVDGYRVAGERALSPGCDLRFGAVRCTFRPNGRPPAPGADPPGGAGGTRQVRTGGLLRRLFALLDDGAGRG